VFGARIARGWLHIVAAPVMALHGVLDGLCARVRVRQAAAAPHLAACAVPAAVLGLQPFAERGTQPAYAQLCDFVHVFPPLQAECVYLGCSNCCCCCCPGLTSARTITI
jgi:hypothetical protein